MWSPVLTPERGDRAMAVARDICERLVLDAETLQDPWPAAERAFTLFEYGHTTGDHRFRASAEAIAEHALQLTATTAMNTRLIGGFVGVACLLEMMEPSDADDEDEDIAGTITQLVAREPHPGMGYLDLVSGLVGMGVYCLARPHCATSRRNLEDIIYRLEETAEELETGTAWWCHTVLGPTQGAQGYNLGLAHGVPGIVALLARALLRGISTTRTAGLLDDAVRWLDSQRLAAGPSVFPTVCTAHGPDGPARSAWCYGDPGVALALQAAASATRRADWAATATQLAKTAARRPTSSCHVGEASFCHGAAGLMHIYNRMYQATGEVELQAAARRWCATTLEMLDQGRWYGGPPDDQTEASRLSHLLDGQAGIALALMAAATSREPTFDALFLADVPAVARRSAPKCA